MSKRSQRPVGAEALPARALTYWNVRSIVGWFGIALAASVAMPQFGIQVPAWLILGCAFLGIIGDIGLLHRWRLAWTTFAVSNVSVELVRGRYIYRMTTMPIRQILHVEIVQGPLLRAFDLVELRFASIVGEHDFGPLRPDVAERIRAQVVVAGGNK